MASSVRKKIKVVEDDDLEELLGPEPGSEPDLQELLNDVELPDPNKKLKVEEGSIDKEPRKPRIVPIRTDLPMGTFVTQKGVRITAPVARYWVVRDQVSKKLYYKEESGVIFLPKDWKDGDPIPELDNDFLQ